MGLLPDTVLARVAANHLAMRNSTSAQKFSVFGTYTDDSNYEDGFIDMSVTTAQTLTIGTATAGTGVDNSNIAITPSGTGQVPISGVTYMVQASIPTCVCSGGGTCATAAGDTDESGTMTCAAGGASTTMTLTFIKTHTHAPVCMVQAARL